MVAMHSINEYLKKYLDNRGLNDNYRQLISSALQDSDVRSFLSANQDEIDNTSIEKSAAAIYEFYQTKQGLNPNQPLLQAGYEPYLRVDNGLIEVAYRLSQQGVALAKTKSEKNKITVLNLPDNLKDITFADYRDIDGRNAAYGATIDLLNQFIAKFPNQYIRGLYLSGPFGIGKTYLMGALANELAQNNVASTLVHFPTFAVQMKQAINDHKVWDRLQKIEKTPVLILDDIGADALSPWVRDEVLGVILQYRMQEQLTTCFTSNFNMAELEQYLSETTQGTEVVKAQRIMERVRFLAQEYEMTGPNIRREAFK
jgi:primosomal protein DnaI